MTPQWRTTDGFGRIGIRIRVTAAAFFMVALAGARAEEPATQQVAAETKSAVRPVPLELVEGSLETPDGVTLFYTETGKADGEPVLLIHGFGVNQKIQWGASGIQADLAKRYRVIALDNRGHGRSDKPHDPERFGQEMVADAIRLLDHLGIEQAHVVGYSMGAMITLNLVIHHPNRLRSATLGGAGWLDGDDPFWIDFQGELAQSLDIGKGFVPLLVLLTPENEQPPNMARIRGLNLMMSAMNDTRALSSVIRGMRELAIPKEALPKNKVPVLALIGDLDPLKRLSVDPMVGVLSNLRLSVVEGGDHMDAFLKPKFSSELQTFLADPGSIPLVPTGD